MSILSARVVGGRYQLHAMLGHGGMAAVWAGLDTRLDRPVAVKMLDGAARADPVMVKRLQHEARTVAGLAHPNIVAVYDVGTDGGVPYLVMELVDGEDLQHRLTGGPLEPGQAIGVAVQICDALQAAHDAGVVHRDIKPDNIMLTRAGSVKVCDFGIARLQQATQVHLTAPTTAIGTSEYMAPEQATGGPMDARTDLYALGCVLYTMLTGGPPFSGDNPMRVLWQQVHEAPPSARSQRPGIGSDLDALTAQLLAKNPADRPGSAAQVRAQLSQLTDFSGTSAALHIAGAAPPRAAAHARSAVVNPTRTMASVDGVTKPSPAPTSLRLGPVGIAAVAIGVATVTAVVVALLAAVKPTQQVGAPANSPTATVSAPANAAATSTNSSVGAVRAVIQAQVQAGQLSANDANDLAGRLNDVDRNLARGRADDAAQKLNDVGDRLQQLRDDNKITNAGYNAIFAALNQLAGALPQGGDNRGKD